MASDYDAALSVAQVLLSNLLKSRKIPTLSVDAIREQASNAARLIGDEIDVDLLTADLSRRFDIFVQQAAVLVDDDDHVAWAQDLDRSKWRFWPRCESYLLGQLPEPVVRRIDEDTDRILSLLGDPRDNAAWYRRGLVVGDVQFGKTSNYSALACKAADAGYKFIIVLAGVHESLRMQTQIRLDDAFLGFRTDQTRALTGVGLLDPSVEAIAATARSLKADFNRIVADQLDVPVGGPPILFVVKKNARMLKNLHSWLNKIARHTDQNGNKTIRNAPALIIDDESDNASVDTSEQSFDRNDGPDLNHKPTAINGLIRQILMTFEQKSYVGYTATPFANIFIHHGGETLEADKDLFPRHFIVNLHAPSTYFGPIRAFGLENENESLDDNTSTKLVRIIDGSQEGKEQLLAWAPAKHKQTLDPGEMPDSLRRAILSFLITCAVRKLRGQVNEHNSMLVHVTRYTRVQGIIYEQIDDAIIKFRRRLRYGDGGTVDSIRAELKHLWNEDFVPTNRAMRNAQIQDAGDLPAWDEVDSILADVASGIRIKQINGLAQDVLDYDNSDGKGIDVIVVGGDKLSRGLTLYGLSISYFTRQTEMYDTLLQMGRWFGYRPGYLDLCRMYTTGLLNSAFEHIALASDELRRDFDYMALIGQRPIDFGLKVLSHPVLAPTSSNKRRHARDLIVYQTYAGGISEAKAFSLDDGVRTRNFAALERLVEAANAKSSPTSPVYEDAGTRRDYAASKLWTGIDWEYVREFLVDYRVEQTATRARADLWLTYSAAQIRKTGELSVWNIALVGGDLQSVDVAGVEAQLRRRVRDGEVEQAGGYRIKRLVTTRDAGVDMPPEVWNAAKAYDPLNKLNGSSRSEPTAHAICWARQQHNVPPLLMIYLPSAPDMDDLRPPVVGAAIAFPGSDRAARSQVKYTVNTVYQTGDIYEEEPDWVD